MKSPNHITNIARFLQALEELKQGTAQEISDKVFEIWPEWSHNKNNSASHPGQIKAEISGNMMSKGHKNVIVDTTTSPAIAVYVKTGDNTIQTNINEDGYNRQSVIINAEENWTITQAFRAKEIYRIVKELKAAGLSLHVDHATSLENGREAAHNPDNFQLLTPEANRTKSSKSWKRYTFERQAQYINSVIATVELTEQPINKEIINILVQQLKAVF